MKVEQLKKGIKFAEQLDLKAFHLKIIGAVFTVSMISILTVMLYLLSSLPTLKSFINKLFFNTSAYPTSFLVNLLFWVSIVHLIISLFAMRGNKKVKKDFLSYQNNNNEEKKFYDSYKKNAFADSTLAFITFGTIVMQAIIFSMLWMSWTYAIAFILWITILYSISKSIINLKKQNILK